MLDFGIDLVLEIPTEFEICPFSEGLPPNAESFVIIDVKSTPWVSVSCPLVSIVVKALSKSVDYGFKLHPSLREPKASGLHALAIALCVISGRSH